MPMERYCLIPDVSHIEEIIRTVATNMIKISPNSFSISRITKNEGCNIRYSETIKAETETPRSVFLILVISQ
jgi:hypothetical protein